MFIKEKCLFWIGDIEKSSLIFIDSITMEILTRMKLNLIEMLQISYDKKIQKNLTKSLKLDIHLNKK